VGYCSPSVQPASNTCTREPLLPASMTTTCSSADANVTQDDKANKTPMSTAIVVPIFVDILPVETVDDAVQGRLHRHQTSKTATARDVSGAMIFPANFGKTRPHACARSAQKSASHMASLTGHPVSRVCNNDIRNQHILLSS
jgi:hypothetical protein